VGSATSSPSQAGQRAGRAQTLRLGADNLQKSVAYLSLSNFNHSIRLALSNMSNIVF
jgi:hypothetical protein